MIYSRSFIPAQPVREPRHEGGSPDRQRAPRERPSPAKPEPQSANRLGALIEVIERLERVVELETDGLRHNRPIDLRELNHRKSHGLLELSRTMRAIDRRSLDRSIEVHLGRLRGKLEKNLAMLQVHLKAVRVISSLMEQTIRDDEWDGTYTVWNGRADATQ